ncbi:MAG: hypothetical protein KDC05_12660 [Bacteroidales bacterium]|nr:hypothetical protein [Bacteroidales bacterium]
MKNIKIDGKALFVSGVFGKMRQIDFADIDNISKLYFLKEQYKIKLRKGNDKSASFQFIAPYRNLFIIFGTKKSTVIQELKEKLDETHFNL